MVVVLISMLMSNMKKLRIVNSVSSVMFIIYGISLHAYPIVTMNVLVIIINLYRLNKGK